MKYVDIIYRIYNKIMKTNINNKVLRISPKGGTLLIKANTKTSSILTPKPLKHDQISRIMEINKFNVPKISILFNG